MYGKLIDYHVEKNKVTINYERITATITAVTPEIIHVFLPLGGTARPSYAIEGEKGVSVALTVERQADTLLIGTDRLKIRVDPGFLVDFYTGDGRVICRDYRGKRRPFVRRGRAALIEEEGHKVVENVSGNRVEVLKELTGDEYFYGLGENTGPLNKRGYQYQLWNTDDPSPHVESHERLYKSVPFLLVLRKETAYGLFFDNTHHSYFNLGQENEEYFYYGAKDGNLNYYFIYGPSIKQVLTGYTYLTGRTPLPQLWTLGYQQSRHSYDSWQRVQEVAAAFRAKRIPCDVLYLDIEYMDGYRVFTWHPVRFAGFGAGVAQLKEKGFKVVTIIDPGVKKEKGYFVYDEGLARDYYLKDKDGLPYVNRVWPGATVYPDFSERRVRQWWGEKHRLLTEQGVAGIWNDMNEPASFDGPIPDDVTFKNEGLPAVHAEMHNVYGHLMAKATYDGLRTLTGKRPFILTRACYAGSQKYAAVWTGDNCSHWEHLRMAVPMLLNLGLSGIAFCGTDVGGFSYDCKGELLARWMQLGAFSPLFRNHSNMFTRDQEPWAFGPAVEEICRKYINLRYMLLPYFYDLLWEGEQTGLPLLRPLFLSYQDDEETYELNDQFMVGEQLLVAPVLQQGQSCRAVYLPAGEWIDYWTGEKHSGKQYVLKRTPLDVCPIYVKAGSILPTYPVQNFVGEREIDELTLEVYPGTGRYTHYQDDGATFNYRQGEYNLYTFAQRRTGDQLCLDLAKTAAGYARSYRSFLLKVKGGKVAAAVADGEKIAFSREGNGAVLRIPATTRRVELSME
ncbi:MAG TPA: glycoside hydrolase family 31 protein [Capillibacterium sp.]